MDRGFGRDGRCGLEVERSLRISALDRSRNTVAQRLGDAHRAVAKARTSGLEIARIPSATEIDHVLHTKSPAAVAAGLAAIDTRLTTASTATDAPRVHLANGLWVQSGLTLEKPFTQTLASLFGAAPQAVNFAGARPDPDLALSRYEIAFRRLGFEDIRSAGRGAASTAFLIVIGPKSARYRRL